MFPNLVDGVHKNFSLKYPCVESEVCKYYPTAQILKNIPGYFLGTGLQKEIFVLFYDMIN
jgi:hypothetical protein